VALDWSQSLKKVLNIVLCFVKSIFIKPTTKRNSGYSKKDVFRWILTERVKNNSGSRQLFKQHS
jgi:hypothetical protein